MASICSIVKCLRPLKGYFPEKINPLINSLIMNLSQRSRILPMISEDGLDSSIYPLRKRRSCSLTSIRDLLKIIAQVLIPLMLGVFTVVIALQQHNLGKENRQKDLEIADRNRLQEYQINEQHRKQEFTLDEAHRNQDLSIADNNHRDSVLNTYVHDLTNLLLRNNYNLSRPLLNSIIRPMTLTVLRQLDPSRKILLVKFLYESKMLNTNFEETRVDLSDADLNGIKFGPIRMQNLSLIATSLINTTFIRTDLTSADFQRADLTNALFINATLSKVSFYRTRLIRVQFFQSNFDQADLSLSDLTQSSMTKSQLKQCLSHNDAILPNGLHSPSQNLIHSNDQCSLNNWKIDPTNTINLTNRCYFIALEDDVTMTYDFQLSKYRRIIERDEALFEFHFKASLENPKYLRADFLFYNDSLGQNLIDRSKYSSFHSK